MTVIYVNQIRQLLNEINECAGEVPSPYVGQEEGATVPCDLDNLCQSCQDKLITLFDWADLSGDEAKA